MSHQKETKINRILRQLPKNAVATTRWLRNFGVGSDLLARYKKTNWFIGLGHGAVIRTGDTPHWTGALYAMQAQLRLPVHLGGKSAIAYQGHSHYVQMGRQKIMLFCPYKTILPKWFEKIDWGVDVKTCQTNLFPPGIKLGFNELQISGLKITASSLERAMLETLLKVPEEQTFDEAKKIMEGLALLRPGVVQDLLEKCNSIKAKRLFLLLAEKENHSWVQRLNKNRINLGKGNRLLIKGGTLDRKYQITIPRDWLKN